MSSEIIQIALEEIGRDPRPERQIRKLDPAWVQHLVDETDPAEWDPISVRVWPKDDPTPPEGPRRYQVISGYHRTAAAEVLNMPTIASIIVDAPDDATFTLLALKGNLRHGKTMSEPEKVAAVERLRGLGMSLGAIAKQAGIPKGTIHNWLANRDTNAARLSRTQQPDAKKPDAVDEDGLAEEWRVMPSTDLDVKRLRQVGSGIHDLLARTFDPADVLAWLDAQPPHMRAPLARQVESRIAWLRNLRIALGMSTAAAAESGGEEDGGEHDEEDHEGGVA